MELRDHVAIVTGSGRGIGRAIALELAEAGAVVVVNARTDREIRKVAEEIRARGGRALAVPADVSRADQAQALVSRVLEEFSQVDVLVNNAGITRDAVLLRMKEEDWDAVLDGNLKSAFHTTRAVARPMLRRRSGRIINITSVVGLTGNSGQANYAASKAGLIGFTRSVAREFASRGITVNAVAPGYIHTQMTRQLPEKTRNRILESIPMGYLGEPEDVARLVRFLASPETRYITGQVFNVDGGMVM